MFLVGMTSNFNKYLTYFILCFVNSLEQSFVSIIIIQLFD